MTTLQDLETRLAELQAQIAAERVAHLNATVQAAVELFTNACVPLDEAASALLAVHNKTARTPRTKVAPKYRHRATGATWTGRGKQPKWFTETDQSEIERLA